jgi:hypothetical protein
MSVFGNHGTYSSGGGDFEAAEEGSYLCNLVEIKPDRRASFDDPNVMEDIFQFTFETAEETDSQGKPFRFVTFPRAKYGNDNANLTKLLDAMIGRRLTQQEYTELDPDELMAQPYRVLVSVYTRQNGNLGNKIVSVKPAKSQAKNGGAKQTFGSMGGSRPAPKPKDEGDDLSELKDPFDE